MPPSDPPPSDPAPSDPARSDPARSEGPPAEGQPPKARRAADPAGRASAPEAGAGAPSVDLAGLDLGHLALFAGLALGDEVLEHLHNRGHPALRFSHGLVFQHLLQTTPTVGELAERMAVTQQAASKRVVELERLGYVRRVADEADARRRLVTLTERGLDAVEQGRAARRAIDERLRRRVRPAQLQQTREVLLELLQASGMAESIRSRRLRWPEG